MKILKTLLVFSGIFLLFASGAGAEDKRADPNTPVSSSPIDTQGKVITALPPEEKNCIDCHFKNMKDYPLSSDIRPSYPLLLPNSKEPTNGVNGKEFTD